jgi:predicted ester cyclase
MAIDFDELLRLWTDPPAAVGAEAAFGRFYADPVLLNGTEHTIADLVVRARGLHTAFEGLRSEVLDRVQTPDRLVIAQLLRGRHTGPLPTPIGTIQPTGREVAIRTIDVLTVVDDRVVAVTVVGDELGLLGQLGALTPIASS